MRNLSKVMAGVVTLAMAGGLLAAATGIANAAYDPANPPYPADPNNQSSLTIYDATTGAVVTTGDSNTALNSYYFVANSDFNPGKTKAALTGFLAEAGKAPGAFSGQSLSAATTYPVATAPAPVNSKTTPVAKGGSTSSFSTLTTNYPNTAPSSSDFFQLYQLRVNTTFPAPASTSYAFMDVQIDPATHTWHQVNPVVGANTAPGAPTIGTATAGDGQASVAFSAPASDGGSPITGYTATSTPGGITATGTGSPITIPGLANGTAYTFTVHATNAVGSGAESAASNSVTPTGPAASATATSVSLSGGPYDTNSDVVVTANVTSAGSPVSSGTVVFTDNLDGALGSAPVSAGAASITKQFSATTTTQHVVTATYSANPTFATSSGQSQAFDVAVPATPSACNDALSQCTEAQFFKATVTAGSLVISTPYTSTNPFDLGDLALNSAATMLTATKPFGSAAIPSTPDQPTPTSPVSAYATKYNGVTLVDRRPGNPGWNANLSTSDFQNGATNKIDGHNLGFTGVTPAYIAGNSLTTGSVSTFNNAPAAGVAPGATTGGVKGTTKFASTAAGLSDGTVYVYGDMTLNAPTSTPAGLYTATVTFTIV